MRQNDICILFYSGWEFKDKRSLPSPTKPCCITGRAGWVGTGAEPGTAPNTFLNERTSQTCQRSQCWLITKDTWACGLSASRPLPRNGTPCGGWGAEGAVQLGQGRVAVWCCGRGSGGRCHAGQGRHRHPSTCTDRRIQYHPLRRGTLSGKFFQEDFLLLSRHISFISNYEEYNEEVLNVYFHGKLFNFC